MWMCPKVRCELLYKDLHSTEKAVWWMVSRDILTHPFVIQLWEPSMGPPTGYPIQYQSNNLINRITVVTNNHNSTGIVTSCFYIGFASRDQQKYTWKTPQSTLQGYVWLGCSCHQYPAKWKFLPAPEAPEVWSVALGGLALELPVTGSSAAKEMAISLWESIEVSTERNAIQPPARNRCHLRETDNSTKGQWPGLWHPSVNDRKYMG
jgi:hypothetical protein